VLIVAVAFAICIGSICVLCSIRQRVLKKELEDQKRARRIASLKLVREEAKREYTTLAFHKAREAQALQLNAPYGYHQPTGYSQPVEYEQPVPVEYEQPQHVQFQNPKYVHCSTPRYLPEPQYAKYGP